MSIKIAIIHQDPSVIDFYKDIYPRDQLFFIHYTKQPDILLTLLPAVLSIKPNLVVVDNAISDRNFQFIYNNMNNQDNTMLVFHRNYIEELI